MGRFRFHFPEIKWLNSYMLIEVRYPENSVECVTVEYLHFPVLKLL